MIVPQFPIDVHASIFLTSAALFHLIWFSQNFSNPRKYILWRTFHWCILYKHWTYWWKLTNSKRRRNTKFGPCSTLGPVAVLSILQSIPIALRHNGWLHNKSAMTTPLKTWSISGNYAHNKAVSSSQQFRKIIGAFDNALLLSHKKFCVQFQIFSQLLHEL